MNEMVMGTCILFGVLIVLMAFRFPISFCLAISAMVTGAYLHIPFMNLFQKMSTGITSFTFMCVPFFIIMAQIMTEGGIADRLTGFCNVIVGRVRGGTAIVNCLNSMLFGGISGSSIADVTSIGALLIPMMQKQGYDTDYSVAVTCTSSVEGVIIPPSQNMIFYVVAASSGLSISTMFMCGYIPGVLFTAALCLTSYIIAVKKKYPISEAHSLKENITIVRQALLGLVTIVIVAVGTSAGIFTATEAGAVAAVYAWFITTFVYIYILMIGLQFDHIFIKMKTCFKYHADHTLDILRWFCMFYQIIDQSVKSDHAFIVGIFIYQSIYLSLT